MNSDLLLKELEVKQVLLSALRIIQGDGCRNYTTGLGSCIKNRPNGKHAKYLAEAWCDSCIAYDALSYAREAQS